MLRATAAPQHFSRYIGQVRCCPDTMPVHASGKPSSGPVMEEEEANEVAVEAIFAQKLACNDATLRRRALKKLRRWLSRRSSQLPDQQHFSEAEMLRLWKGLFYCFWMCDKPLLQEELAESISSMVFCFDQNHHNAGLFIAAGLITLGREWRGIDIWRMDKFMMFVRRMLRHAFSYLAKLSWPTQLVDKLAAVFENYVVCTNCKEEGASSEHISGKKMKKKKKKKVMPNLEEVPKGGLDLAATASQMSLGFQMHFIDVFLEELAKVGGEKLPVPVLHQLLQPFTKALMFGTDFRIMEHIEVRIFRHLMRQSDVGIAYEELGFDPQDPEAAAALEDGDDDEVEGDDDDDDDDDEEEPANVLDPRAGKVDVVLPQLQADFQRLSEELFKAGSAANVMPKKRERLYRLSSQFKALAKGEYPLAVRVPKVNPQELDIQRLISKKVKQEDPLSPIMQMRNEAKQFRAELKRKAKEGSSHNNLFREQQEPVTKKAKVGSGGDDDGDEKEEDDGLEVLYRHSPNQKAKKKTKKKMKAKVGSGKEEEEEDSPEVSDHQSPDTKLTALKKQKKKKKNPAKVEPSEEGDIEVPDHQSPETPPTKKKKKEKAKAANCKEDVPEVPDQQTPDTKRAKNKRKSKVEPPEVLEEPEVPDQQTPETKRAKNKRKSKVEPPEGLEEPEVRSPDSNLTQKKKKKKSEESPASQRVTTKGSPEVRTVNGDGVHGANGASSLLLNMSTEKPKQKSKKAGKNVKEAQGEAEGGDQVVVLTPAPATAPRMTRKKKDHLSATITASSASKLKRKINFSLLENRCQSLQEIDQCIKQSPDIPFNAELKPKQGVLKNTPTSCPKMSNTSRNMVAYNTLINGRSPFMKKLGRPTAQDFMM